MFPEVHPRSVRPAERSPQVQNPDAKSRGTRDKAVRLRHVEPARVLLRHAAPSPPQILDSLHRLVVDESTINRAHHPISQWHLDTLFKTGSVRASRRLYAGGGSCVRDLWRAWRIRDGRSAWCSENWSEARAVRGARKKSGWGVSWTSELSASTPTSGRLQPRARGNGAERRNKVFVQGNECT